MTTCRSCKNSRTRTIIFRRLDDSKVSQHQLSRQRRRPQRWLPCAVSALLAVSAAALIVADGVADDALPSRTIELFNGTDLNGWKRINGAPGTWQVREGMIVCTGEPRGYLRTEKMYENYILELEWRHAKPGGNSGIFFHADGLPQTGAPYPRGLEAQLLDEDHGSLFGLRGASLVPLTNPDKKGGAASARPLERRCRPAGEWNQYVLRTQDGTVELAVNGKVVTRAKKTSLVAGYIGLQAEHGEVHFRNIRIQPLAPGNPKVEQIAQKDDGFRSLQDGLSFDGWNHRPGHQGHWVTQDGEIHYDGQAEADDRWGKDLWSEKEFGDFVLVADWRLPAKPTMKPHPIVLDNGDFVFDGNGKRKTFQHLDAGDSGIYLRGNTKCQINIWSQQLGSGEINGYRTDGSIAADIRKACLPTKYADHDFGQWNRFVITMRGQHITVVLNRQTIIDAVPLPDLPSLGPIGLQHHNDPVQFRNLFIRELN